MASKNDENFISFCDELRAYVEEHHLLNTRKVTFFLLSGDDLWCLELLKNGALGENK